MKKLISLVLIFVLCFSVSSVLAENETAVPAAAAASESFSFRNGITWGMSADEVRSAENRSEEYFREEGNITSLVFGYTDVSKYTADFLMYLFVDDQLKSVVYIFNKNWNDASVKYFNGALTQLYGDPVEMTKEEITAEFSFDPWFDGSAITAAYGWNAPGATIRLTVDTELDITYTDPSFTSIETYNTNGL